MKGAIVYISSNRENPDFERRIVDDMMRKKGDLPIFSVTQKPMDLGTNKCVGDVGTSGFNFCRQLQMVVEMAKVDYVVSCEADCLYSPDYFKFIPTEKTIYRNMNNLVIPYRKDYFRRKDMQTAFQVAHRDYFLSRLNFLLKGQPQWDLKMFSFPKEIGLKFLEKYSKFSTEYPCITIKTGKGMRRRTHTNKIMYNSIPHWGTVKQVKEKYL